MPEMEAQREQKKQETAEERVDKLINEIADKDAESVPAANRAEEIKEEIKKNGSEFTMKEYEKILQKVVKIAPGDLSNQFLIDVKDAIEKTKENGKINEYFMLELNKSIQKAKDEMDLMNISMALNKEDAIKALEEYAKNK